MSTRDFTGYKTSSISGMSMTILLHSLVMLLALQLWEKTKEIIITPAEKNTTTISLNFATAEAVQSPVKAVEVPPEEATSAPLPAHFKADEEIQKPPVSGKSRTQPRQTVSPPKTVESKTTPETESSVLPSEQADSATSKKANATQNANEKQMLLSSLMSQIEKYKHYPKAAQRAGRSGTVMVMVTIGSAGDIQKVTLLDSSDRILSDGAVTTMENVRKNWKYSNWTGGVLEIKIPVAYKIKG